MCIYIHIYIYICRERERRGEGKVTRYSVVLFSMRMLVVCVEERGISTWTSRQQSAHWLLISTLYIYIYIYIYTHVYREREREREILHTYNIYIYIYIRLCVLVWFNAVFDLDDCALKHHYACLSKLPALTLWIVCIVDSNILP